MSIVLGGLTFREAADGGVIIDVGHNATDNAENIRSVILSHDEWREVVEMTLPVVDPPTEVEEVISPKQPLDTTPGTIATVASDLAIELVKEVTTLEDLTRLENEEIASIKHPAGRKGVLEAIDHQREKLTKSN